MVELSPLPEGTERFPAEFIRDFMAAAFRAAGLPEDDALLAADVLLSADLRGIRSHGAARLPLFIGQLERGGINKSPRMKFCAGSDTTGVLDGDNALGIIAANQAMEEALCMAERHGSGFVAARNSNHFGYPAYYARKAVERGFIGISMTNGGRFVAPTFGIEPILGTNPLNVAIPGGPGGRGFHLDMATSTVARGKIETALREGKPIPKGWVPEAFGELRLDERGILPFDVPLLPLGGEGTETAGHKGYGLSLMVELLCTVLAGLDIREEVEAAPASHAKPPTGHFMGAVKLGGFREPALICSQMEEIFERIRGSKKAPGQDRIYTPGELEASAEGENRRLGIPITPPVLEQLRRLNHGMNLGFEL